MNKMLRILILILCTFSWLSAMSVQEIGQKTGIEAGLVVFPELTAFEQARPFLDETSYVVYAQQADAALCKKIREQAGPFLNSNFYLVQGSSEYIHLADRMACLIIVNQSSQKNISVTLRAELERVLAPARGAALFNDGSVLTMPMPQGADSWSHRYHSADHVRASEDATIKPPFMTQWLGLPIFDGYWGSSGVLAGGRYFFLGASRFAKEALTLRVRSLHNGLILWERGFQWESPKNGCGGGYYPGRSAMVATPDTFYLVDEDDVQLLNPETGLEIDRITGPINGGQIKWMGVEDNRVALLAGESDVYKAGSLQSTPKNTYGKTLAVIDAESRQVLWTQEECANIREMFIVMRAGKLYYYVTGEALVCRDLQTGEEVWRNQNVEVMQRLSFYTKKKINHISQPGLVAYPEALVFGGAWSTVLFFIDPATGALMWKLDNSRKRDASFMGTAAQGHFFYDKVYDLKTGSIVKPSFKMPKSGCGPSFPVGDYLATSFGGIHERESGKKVREVDVKPACDLGILIGESTLVSAGGQCSCNYPIQGYRAYAPATQDPKQWQEPDQRHQIITSYTGGLKADASDWPTFRQSFTHDGSSSALVPEQLEQLWSMGSDGRSFSVNEEKRAQRSSSAETERLPTPPISVGEKTWFVDGGGVLHCMISASGAVVWSYTFDSVILSSPTFWQGRLFVGGGDGKLYSLNASTGELLWIFKGAPRDRRIFWYGHLLNTWPVVASPIVQNGTVFFTAGFHLDDRVHTYALDASSGAVIWETHHTDVKGEPAFRSQGQMTISAKQLWLSTASMIPGSYDVANGTASQDGLFGKRDFCRRGGFIGILWDKWLLYGGERIMTTDDTWSSESPTRYLGFSFRSVDESRKKMSVQMLSNSRINPVWDEEHLFAVCKDIAHLQGWSKETLSAQLEAGAVTPKRKTGITKIPTLALQGTGKKVAVYPALPVWSNSDVKVVAMILAQNAIITTHAIPTAGKQFSIWGLSAFDRNTGTVLWSVELSVQPIMDGLSMDRHGRIYVTARDGSVCCFGQSH